MKQLCYLSMLQDCSFDGLEKWLQQLPQVPQFFQEEFGLRIPKGEAERTQLIKDCIGRGAIDAFPIGCLGKDFLVVRLCSEALWHVAVVYHDAPEALTIAPDLESSLHSILCYANPSAIQLYPGDLEEAVSYSIHWGCDANLMPKLIQKLTESGRKTGGRAQLSAAWRSLHSLTDNPFFKLLADVWSLENQELLEAIAPWGGKDPLGISSRAVAMMNALGIMDQDFEVAISRLLQRDDYYDATYGGNYIGAIKGATEGRSSALAAIHLLRKKGGQDGIPVKLLEVAKANALLANDYGGAQHRALGKSLATSDPQLAMAVLRTAAAFHSHQTNRPPDLELELTMSIAATTGEVHLHRWIAQWKAMGD